MYRKVPNLRILVCGGDGTVSIISQLCGSSKQLSCLDEAILVMLHTSFSVILIIVYLARADFLLNVKSDV